MLVFARMSQYHRDMVELGPQVAGYLWVENGPFGEMYTLDLLRVAGASW